MNGDGDKTPPQSQDSIDEKGDIELIVLDDDDENFMKDEDLNMVWILKSYTPQRGIFQTLRFSLKSIEPNSEPTNCLPFWHF